MRHPNGPFNPSTPGSRASSPTSTSSIWIMPVIDARSDSLPSIFGVSRPLAPFSSTNPRMAPPWASDFAHTTNTSAIGELEIQVFAPDSRYPPSTLRARVVMPPGSDPASGSVRPKQPIHSPLARRGR